MANEDLTVRLKADDQLTPKVKEATKAVEKLEDTKVELELDADVSRVLTALEDVTAETKATAEAAEVLGRALGPELAAKADTTAIVGDLKNMGLTLDQIKGNADELGAKMRELSDADVGGKLGSSLGTARGKMDELAKSADSSKSVLANMVGNATQDLGALGGIAGSAGVAIGQMGEYMVDAAAGGDKMKDVLRNFAAVAGPIALIATAVQVASGVMKDNAAAAELAAERVKQMGEAMSTAGDDVVGIADSLREGSDALRTFNSDAEGFGGGIVEGIAEIAKNIPLLGGLIGEKGQGIENLVPVMDAAGLSMYDLAAAIEEGGSVTGEWQRQLSGALHSGKISESQYNAMSQAVFDYSSAAKEASTQQELFNVSGEEAAQIFKDLEISDDPLKAFAGSFKIVMDDLKNGGDIADVTATTINRLSQELGVPPSDVIAMAMQGIAIEGEAAAAATQKLVDALLAEAAALTASVDAMRGSADATLALTDAQDGMIDAIQESATAQADAKLSADEHRDAVNAERDAIISVARAAEEQAAAVAEADGATASATGQLDAFNDALLSNANFATPAARDAIADYIVEANSVPAEKVTDIKAAIARGDIAEAKRLLDEASAARDATIKADANTAQANTELDNVANKKRTAVIGVKILGVQFDQGGTVGRDGGIAGERGPEFIRLPDGREGLLSGESFVPPRTRVTSTRQTRQMLARGQLPRYANGTGVNTPGGQVDMIWKQILFSLDALTALTAEGNDTAEDVGRMLAAVDLAEATAEQTKRISNLLMDLNDEMRSGNQGGQEAIDNMKAALSTAIMESAMLTGVVRFEDGSFGPENPAWVKFEDGSFGPVVDAISSEAKATSKATSDKVAEVKIKEDPNTPFLRDIKQTLLEMASHDRSASAQASNQLYLLLSAVSALQSPDVDSAVRAAAMTIRAGRA